MSTKVNSLGFTIIEVIIVLATTSALAMAIIAYSQISITNQRYNDSVNSLRDFLQAKYDQLDSLSIGESVRSDYCGSGIDDSYKDRGRTGCFVIGFLIRALEDEGDTVFTVDRILVRENKLNETLAADPSINDSDLYVKSDVLLSIEGFEQEKYALAWDASVKRPLQSDLAQTSIAIIKSPINGSVKTYSLPSAIAADSTNGFDFSSLVTDANLVNTTELCVHPKGISFDNIRAVVIRPNASNSTGVEIAPLDQAVNGVNPVKC